MKTLLVLWAILPSLALAAARPKLRVSAIPDESPSNLQRKFAPLRDYLSREVGVDVKFIPVTDYPATVEGLASKHLDLVWYGGFTFIQAYRRTGKNALPLVQREEDAAFHSKFIASADSKIEKLEDLKGKTMAFGSVSSTSGHLMPRYYMLQAKLDPDKILARYSFSGAHDATAKWVEAGKVDAGALNEAVLDTLIRTRKIDPSKIRVFYTTPAYPDYTWTVRADLDAKLIEKLKRAFLALDDQRPEHRAILELQGTRKYIPTDPEKYKLIEEAAISAGLLKD